MPARRPVQSETTVAVISSTPQRVISMAAQPTDVLNFWRAAGHRRWFEKDDAFDAAIRLKFEPTHHAAARGEYADWIDSADGALALLILLDQFPRNLYRGSAHSWATDGLAHSIAAQAIERGHDKR